MNAGFSQVNLDKMISAIGEEKVRTILSSFECPLNKDVQGFIRNTAIEFSKQGIAKTFLVFASYKKKWVLVAYYTLASNKHITVDFTKKPKLGKQKKKRITKFAKYDKEIRKYVMSMPLIAQLGKNYQKDIPKLITGDEILKMAIDRVISVQQVVGGKWVYLECEDRDSLKEFYESNGFVCFGSRELDAEETSVIQGKYLLQYLKYLHI